MASVKRPMTGKWDRKVERYARERQRMGARSSRYMLIRYGSAVLFFLDLFWAMFLGFYRTPLLLLPVAGVIGGIVSAVEVTSALDGSRERLPKTKAVLEISGACLVLVMLLVPIVGKEPLFPFLSSSLVAEILCSSALLLRVLLLHRINQISARSDKKYQTYRKLL